MPDPHPHFRVSEFDCKDNCGYGQPHPRLMSALEALRRECGGKPLVIVSGVRCPPRNAAVGGAPRSRHQAGEAADIPEGYATRSQAVRAGFTGIGTKGKWVTHVDVRRAREPVFWRYDS